MKFFFTIGFVASFLFSIAQDCSLVSNQKDKFSGKSTWSSNETLIISGDGGKTGLGIFCMIPSSGKSVILSIHGVARGFKCVDEGDEMEVLFKDGSHIKLVNSADFNCEGKFTVYFLDLWGHRKELDQLASKDIDAVRVWGKGDSIEESFSSDQASKLKNTLRCLITKIAS